MKPNYSHFHSCPYIKVTQLERNMNILVAVLFVTLFFFASMMAAGSQITMNAQSGDWYLEVQNKWPDLGVVSQETVPNEWPDLGVVSHLSKYNSLLSFQTIP